MVTPTGLFPPARSSGLRFRSRHVHKTVAAFLAEKLDELGWVNDPVNFSATPITFKEIQPDENGVTVAANTVSVSAGDLSEDTELQLGGGLYEVVLPVFVDVYGESSSLSQSIAEDAKDQLSRGLTLPLIDWSDVQGPKVLADGYIEIENVIGPSRPQQASVSQDFRRHWRVVKAEAHVTYGS